MSHKLREASRLAVRRGARICLAPGSARFCWVEAGLEIQDKPMTHGVKPDHPRSTFCFYVSGRQLGDDTLKSMQALLALLAENRTWVLGPPLLADEQDGVVRRIGGTLDLYTALPPLGADLPKEVDRQHLEEVTAIVEALQSFSERTGFEVTFTLDQTYVGRIKAGEPDELIRVGLLGEWRKAHGMG